MAKRIAQLTPSTRINRADPVPFSQGGQTKHFEVGQLLPDIDVTHLGAYDDGTHPEETIAAVVEAETILAAKGGGIVKFPGPGIYNLEGRAFYLPTPNITWKGGMTGPFYFNEGNPAVVPQAPTLLITNDTEEFMYLAAAGRMVEDLAFVYPEQEGNVPIVYPYTLRQEVLGFKLRRCTFYNSYNAIHLRNGGYSLEDCIILGLNNDIFLDRCPDRGRIERVFCGGTGYPLPDALLVHMLNNRVSFKVRRADDFEFSMIRLGFCNKGFDFAENTADVGFTGGSYGSIQAASIDGCIHGVYASSTMGGQVGVTFTDFDIGDGGIMGLLGVQSHAAVKVVAPTGGAARAQLVMVGGAMRGDWDEGDRGVVQPASAANGYAAVSQCINYDLPLDEWQPATLQNSWVNYDASHVAAAYQKYLKGMGRWRVRMNGLIKNGTATAGTILFQVPAGYRPAKQEVFSSPSSGGVGQVEVWPDGTVRLFVGANSYVSLAEIDYDVAG